MIIILKHINFLGIYMKPSTKVKSGFSENYILFNVHTDVANVCSIADSVLVQCGEDGTEL